MPPFLRLISAALVSISFAFMNQAMAEILAPAQIQEITQKANAGEMQAQMDLASRYHSGDGLKQDLKQAAYWYKQLADKGVAQAQLTLGLMHIKGEGVAQDNQQALHWFNLAAEQRLSSAQYLLGLAYAEGHGVKSDKVTAYMWYEISAALEYPDAIEARAELAKQMNKEEIVKAEQMATDWWMKFHH